MGTAMAVPTSGPLGLCSSRGYQNPPCRKGSKTTLDITPLPSLIAHTPVTGLLSSCFVNSVCHLLGSPDTPGSSDFSMKAPLVVFKEVFPAIRGSGYLLVYCCSV